MVKYAKWILPVLLGVLIIEILIVAPESLNPKETTDVVDEEASDAGKKFEQSMNEVHLVETRDGEKEWELWADKAFAIQLEQKWTLQNVRTVFFGDDGVYFTVTGEAGAVEPKTKNMEVSGNVVTRSSNGYVFRSESIRYTSVTRKLESQEKVKMIGPADKDGNHMELTGLGMVANLAQSEIDVLNNVDADKGFPKNKRARIRSQRAKFSGVSRMAKFIGDVVIDYDGMRITGPEANFLYDKKKDVITSMYVKDGVRVSDAMKFATSDNVKVFFQEEKFVFRGSPRVVQNNDELRGEQIVFLEGGDRVKVMKVRARVDENSSGGNL